MSNKHRAILKALYFIIFIIIFGFYTSSPNKILGTILWIYIIFGALLSSYLKLPLLTKLNLYNVDKEYYGSVDTFTNLIFTFISIGALIYSFFI